MKKLKLQNENWLNWFLSPGPLAPNLVFSPLQHIDLVKETTSTILVLLTIRKYKLKLLMAF